MVLVVALLLGAVAGLRTFTAPALLWILRHGGPIGYVLGGLALLEYAGDLYPGTPARTAPAGLIPRLLSGAFCGWALTAPGGSWVILGTLLGACGALIGTYSGLAVRLWAIARIGRVPAALLEDGVAILAGVLIVSLA